MKNFTEEQIEIMYKNLPNDLKTVFFSANKDETIESIGRKHNLTIDKIGELANETGMVMLGVTHPNEFIGNLAERLEVDKEKARAIAGDINEQVFKKVRESLRKIHNMREGGEEEQKTEIEHHQGPSLMVGQNREDILKEIEKDHGQENLAPEMPEIMKSDINPFEEKMKEGVLIAPVEEKHYIEEKPQLAALEPEKSKKDQKTDPYREPVE